MNDGIALNSTSHPRPVWWKRPYWWLRSLRGISPKSITTGTVWMSLPPGDVNHVLREGDDGRFVWAPGTHMERHEATLAELETVIHELAALGGAKPNVTGTMRAKVEEVFAARDLPTADPEVDEAAGYLARCFGYAWTLLPEGRTGTAPWGFAEAARQHALRRDDFRDLVRGALRLAAPKLEPVKPDLVSPWQPMTDALALKHLGKLGEETCELGAAVFRCIIQGIDEAEPVTGKPNRQWLEEETADVRANIELCVEHFALDENEIGERMKRKMRNLRKWHEGA